MNKMYCKKERAVMLLDEIIPIKHLEWVAEQLGCTVAKLVILDVQPDVKEYDEEGWNLTSFFPENGEVESEMLEPFKVYGDFQISNIQKITVDGVTYIGDQDACPWTIYAKYDEKMMEIL